MGREGPSPSTTTKSHNKWTLTTTSKGDRERRSRCQPGQAEASKRRASAAEEEEERSRMRGRTKIEERKKEWGEGIPRLKAAQIQSFDINWSILPPNLSLLHRKKRNVKCSNFSLLLPPLPIVVRIESFFLSRRVPFLSLFPPILSTYLVTCSSSIAPCCCFMVSSSTN
jgi:hypothetical protein